MEPSGFPGVYRHGRDLYTVNAEPGRRVYGEELRRESQVEYRHFDPFRSKLAAWILKRTRPSIPEAPENALYLGGAHGTTVSHLSDSWPKSALFVVEKSALTFAPLLELSKRRENLLPILADAQLPERYAADVGEVGFLYMDIAQRNQAEIFVENARACLAAAGHGLLMLKVRSVSQARDSRSVASAARTVIERAGWTVLDATDLAPFSREHVALWVEG